MNNIWCTVSLALSLKLEDVCLFFVYRVLKWETMIYICLEFCGGVVHLYITVHLALIDVFGGGHHAL